MKGRGRQNLAIMKLGVVEEMKPKMFQKMKPKIIDTILVIIFLFLLLEYLESGKKYILGFVLFILVYSIYQVWSHKELIISLMKQIETILYGKPLDKELWKDGELKRVKRKWVIKK